MAHIDYGVLGISFIAPVEDADTYAGTIQLFAFLATWSEMILMNQITFLLKF